MASNLLTTIGAALILLCLVLFGGWKLAIGVLGVFLLIAGYHLNAGRPTPPPAVKQVGRE